MIRSLLEQLYSFFLTKASWLLVFFAPAGAIIMAIGFIIIADCYLGIKVARKKGEKFEYVKIRTTWDKFTSYGVGILVGFVVQENLFPGIPAIQGMASLIIYLELKSINRNIETITGVNMFKGLLSAINPKKKQQ